MFQRLSVHLPIVAIAVLISSGCQPAVTPAGDTVTNNTNNYVLPPTSHLLFTAVPTKVVAGATFDPVVKVGLFDGEGKLVTAFTGAVRLSLGENATLAELDGALSVNAVDGIATFEGLKVTRAAMGYTLRAATDGFETVESLAFTVAPGPVAAAVFKTQPTNRVAGLPFDPPLEIELTDAYGNLATSASGDVTFTLQSAASEPVSEALLGDTTMPPVLGELFVPDLAPTVAGLDLRLVASVGGVTVTSRRFDVTPGAAAQLFCTNKPGNLVAGEAFAEPLLVEVQDRYGNLVPVDGVSIDLLTKDGAGEIVSEELRTKTTVRGVATFTSYRQTKAGLGLTLYARAQGLTAGASGTFDVAAGPISSISFTSQPKEISAGGFFNPPVAVAVSDQYGNPVPGNEVEITLRLEVAYVGSVSSGLQGTVTQQTVSGVATFPDLTITKARTTDLSYVLVATGGTFGQRTSDGFYVKPLATSTLAITAQPQPRALGYTLAPSLEVSTADMYGNPTTDAAQVTVALDTNPTGAALTGTLTRATSGGKATFNDLALDKAGIGFKLAFSAPSLPSVTSDAFDVVALNTSTSLTTGPNHTCGIRTDLSIYCVGDNAAGQLGSVTVPQWNAGEKTPFAALFAGTDATCALRADGTAWCRGKNTTGVLGDGTFVSKSTFTQEASHSTWKQLSIGGAHTCGIKTDNSLWCWGAGIAGQRGDGQSGSAVAATATAAREQSASTWLAVSAGTSHTCGIKSDHSLWCWGEGADGRLGDGTTVGKSAPVQESTGSSWKAVSAGAEHTCGIKADDSLWCWGLNAQYTFYDGGRLGDGTVTARSSPVQESTHGAWSQVTAGGKHTCALRTNGGLWCWGDGTVAFTLNPVQEINGATWTTVSAGADHVCALRPDRSMWCWGAGGSRQLGSGGTSSQSNPWRENSGSSWGP
jgi:alpha-tubulin suppressor-like RCC1 family protein